VALVNICCTGKMKNLPGKIKVGGKIALRLPGYGPEQNAVKQA